MPKQKKQEAGATLERSARGPKPSHSREKIARVAVELADERGLDAVSIRAVAQQIGAGAASLYRYVDSSDQLLDLMVDRVSGEYVFDELAGSPEEQLLALAAQGRAIMHTHRWLAPLVQSTRVPGPQTLHYLESALSALAGTALSGTQKLQTIAMLTAITSAFVINELSQQDAQPRGVIELQQALASGQYPLLTAAFQQADPTVDQDGVFGSLIRNYLRGAGIFEA
ncbi:TetR/AcrR family transcriptional regulator [Glutamicibacter bergerei]|uniref:TetR/AcrR family transcriptional regulator n=2 Tax=Glutamicibacter TaxID=1742989 RepID=A0ABV9ML50_9MICC|nr:TetR/AcrR family transcriptional regulator [Glutamicibacter ardleyensis]GGJ61949.1 TetR family transcriptional regulator [Glutamicibacter ardleyensis]